MTNSTRQSQKIPQEKRPETVLPSGSTDSYVKFEQGEIEQSVTQRFEQQVRLYGHRLAVKTRNRSLTYDDLNTAANRLARRILQLRGEEEEPVALLLSNDADMMVAILAVLKVGKIYVPLVPASRLGRNELALQDLRAKLMVTNNRHMELASELNRSGLQVLNVDELGPESASDDLALSIPPDSKAFILYTSGSTGQPKGIVTDHRSLLHHVMTVTNDYRLCADDRMTLMQSPAFSLSRHEMFGALLNGAAVFPWDILEEGLVDLADWLAQERISFYGSVLTTFRYFAGTLTGKEEFPDLRLVCLGGEPLHQRDVELFRRHFPSHCTLVHTYGTTETGRVMLHVVTREAEAYASGVQVDRVIPDYEVLLLDESGQEVGCEHAGEIVVRSPYLAQGYWQRPDLTEAAFLPDPCGGHARMWRSGDLGRMLGDGRLLHLGRKDSQVKIRGHRVDVSEIEMTLQDHDAIKQAAAAVHERLPGEMALVGYLVPERQSLPTEQELRAYMEQRIPDHMVPSAYVALDSLPLTATGKLNRRELSAPDWSQIGLPRVGVGPRTQVEEVLANIWVQILGVERIGVHDNFFELGGHSLLATRVNSRLRDLFQVELALPTFFERPTIAELARLIEEALATGTGTPAPEIAPLPRDWHRVSPSWARETVTSDYLSRGE